TAPSDALGVQGRRFEILTMLSEGLLELLTAYVDGELPAAKQDAVQRLLQRSPEARALVACLKEDAARLRALLRLPLPADFRERVLERAKTQPEPTRHSPCPRRFPWVWAAVAAAAALLV